MTLILPNPPNPLPEGYISLELALLRDQTTYFIAANPIDLVLNPVRHEKTNTGAMRKVSMMPRPPQRLRLISMNASQKPTITEDGIEREIDLTLLGEWNAQIDVNDWWRDGEGLLYEVIEMVPFNGYEVRALVVKSGHA